MKFLLLVSVLVLQHTTHVQGQADVGCVANAEKSANGQCACKEGYHGNGDLCCMPNDHKMCLIEGDPLVRAMNGDLIPLDLPCPTMVAEVHTIGPNYDETVYAFLAGEYGPNGIINMDYLRLVYEERFNDIHTEIEVFNGNLTINGNVHDRSQMWASPSHEVELTYNPSTDTYMMLSMGTTMIHFVPPSQSTAQQKTTPGVCVGVVKNALLYDIGMCNQRRRGLQRSSINKGFAFLNAGVVEHVIRRLPVDEVVGPKSVQSKCLALNKSRQPCGDKWNPSIAACFPITSHPDIRYCLTKAGLDVMKVFHDCTMAHCGLDQPSCGFINSPAVKQCIDIDKDCSVLYTS